MNKKITLRQLTEKYPEYLDVPIFIYKREGTPYGYIKVNDLSIRFNDDINDKYIKGIVISV